MHGLRRQVGRRCPSAADQRARVDRLAAIANLKVESASGRAAAADGGNGAASGDFLAFGKRWRNIHAIGHQVALAHFDDHQVPIASQARAGIHNIAASGGTDPRLWSERVVIALGAAAEAPLRPGAHRLPPASSGAFRGCGRRRRDAAWSSPASAAAAPVGWRRGLALRAAAQPVSLAQVWKLPGVALALLSLVAAWAGFALARSVPAQSPSARCAGPDRAYTAARCHSPRPAPCTPSCVAKLWNRGCRSLRTVYVSWGTGVTERSTTGARPCGALHDSASAASAPPSANRAQPKTLLVGARPRAFAANGISRSSAAGKQRQRTDQQGAGDHGREHAEQKRFFCRRYAPPRPNLRQRSGQKAG